MSGPELAWSDSGKSALVTDVLCFLCFVLKVMRLIIERDEGL